MLSQNIEMLTVFSGAVAGKPGRNSVKHFQAVGANHWHYSRRG